MSVVELSQFQKEKFSYLFNKFYDTNKNGVITLSDFTQMLGELTDFRQWGPNDSRLHQCEETLNKVWVALKLGADLNADQQVTEEEWFCYWAEFLRKSKLVNDGWPTDIPWVKDYMDFWFDFMDTSGDGQVDEQEYVQVCTMFGIGKQECQQAFAKFASRPVDHDYFAKLWLQFMTSDRRDEPGNYLFGKASWD